MNMLDEHITQGATHKICLQQCGRGHEMSLLLNKFIKSCKAVNQKGGGKKGQKSVKLVCVDL